MDTSLDMNLSDPIILGLANMVMIEIAKRWKAIPLDPANTNQIKFVSGCLLLLLALGRMTFATIFGGAAAFDLNSIGATLKVLVQLWVEGWIVSHIAYQAVPYVKPTPETEVEVVPVVNADGTEANRAFVKEESHDAV